MSAAWPGPADVRALRDKGNLARLMVLRALARGPAHSLRQVAEELGVTVQAVSEHLKRLTAEALVESDDEGTRLTARGHEALRDQLAALKEYVDGAVRELARIETTPARAGARIVVGDAVGLFMEQGDLVAYPGRDSPSKGRAEQDAEAGQDVLVGDLQGIVHLEPGRVVFGVVPDTAAGGSRKVDLRAVRREAEGAHLVLAIGPVARHVADVCGTQVTRFGSAWAAVEAAMRGLDVLVLIEESELGRLEARFAEAKAVWGLELSVRRARLAADG